jgi:CheY-like chemotaxis protein
MADEIRPKVLMADDDDEDCFLAKEALAATGTNVDFSTVTDGLELMAHLWECICTDPGRLPDVILLDLNMPRKDGREVLLEIRAKLELQNIPIVILTTSEEEDDMVFTKKAGADTFMTKPNTFDEWVELMKSVAECWL